MLGGYILLFPRASVVTVIFIVFFFTILELPALLVLGIWFLQQALFGYFDLAQPSGGGGGVAYFAHIGGFVFGLLAVRAVREPQTRRAPARPHAVPRCTLMRRGPRRRSLLLVIGGGAALRVPARRRRDAPRRSRRATAPPGPLQDSATAPLAGGGTAPSPLAVRLDLPGDPVSIKLQEAAALGAAVRPRHRPGAVARATRRGCCRSPR